MSLASLLWLLTAAVPGCFKPDRPACAFSCASPPHTCPTGFTCGADDLCHDPISAGICAIVPTDASPADASVSDATGTVDASVDTQIDTTGDRAGQ